MISKTAQVGQSAVQSNTVEGGKSSKQSETNKDTTAAAKAHSPFLLSVDPWTVRSSWSEDLRGPELENGQRR